MEQYAIEVDEDDSHAMQEIRSTVASKKGRGFSSVNEMEAVRGVYEALPYTADQTIEAQRSIEGWAIFVTGLHEECDEDEIKDRFGEFGPIREIRLNLDHRTGYVKGYAIVEYESYGDAKAAVDNLNGQELMGQNISVSFAFLKPRK